jgi:hypothetical protein
MGLKVKNLKVDGIDIGESLEKAHADIKDERHSRYVELIAIAIIYIAHLVLLH